jgi:hypothetical protein
MLARVHSHSTIRPEGMVERSGVNLLLAISLALAAGGLMVGGAMRSWKTGAIMGGLSWVSLGAAVAMLKHQQPQRPRERVAVMDSDGQGELDLVMEDEPRGLGTPHTPAMDGPPQPRRSSSVSSPEGNSKSASSSQAEDENESDETEGDSNSPSPQPSPTKPERRLPQRSPGGLPRPLVRASGHAAQLPRSDEFLKVPHPLPTLGTAPSSFRPATGRSAAQVPVAAAVDRVSAAALAPGQPIQTEANGDELP